MKTNTRYKGIRGNVQLALTIFVLFLVVFEDKLQIPAWLQPVGRMHAMILHFPIVVILMAVMMEFFRFSVRPDSKKFYSDLSHHLLFAGVVLAGITVIMGIFLSREGAFTDESLFWHKWTGIGVYFVSAGIYVLRESSWFTPVIARTGAAIALTVVVLAGHLGAQLTHGENFVLQPVTPVAVKAPERVSVEEALIFDHVIKPVLDSKCNSCHNSDKKKGKLLLTDSASLLKGGKTGKLFVAGQTEESLLLDRIHLPVEEEEHMPPSGKLQLTEDEKDLFYHWIRSYPGFSRRLASLPETDSLRMIATRVLETMNHAEDRYDFPAVAQETIEKLNSNYRVIRPIAKNSSALSVNVYNRSIYTPQTLEELKAVKTQVISLDLSKMPVTDEDLKSVARLENLNRLNLNFTEVTGAGILHLLSLKKLAHLSLSGTSAGYDDLRKVIPGFVNLETLSVWETTLTQEEIAALQKEFRHVKILGESHEGGMLIKLNPPRLNNKSKVFTESLELALYHPVRGVDIRFTTDGTDPDSISSPLFKGKEIVTETSSIRARAFKDGWQSSDVVTLTVYQCSKAPDTAMLLTKMSRVHTANGAQTFFDNEFGSFNANSPAWANNWGGFRNDMELLLRYDKPARISSVTLNTLIETETSIFPPEIIEVWGGPTRDNMKLIARKVVDLPSAYRKPYIEMQHCSFETHELSWLKIVAKPVMKLRPWHKNKGKAALMLIDEILVN